MRRLALTLFVVAATFTVDVRPTRALPRFSVERYYFANACDPAYRYGPGQVGEYLGERISGCYGSHEDISESSLVGYDNWKQEVVYDCDSGDIEITWFHGGHMNWTQMDPQTCVWYQ